MTQPYLQGDETPMQVLREPGKLATSKSYMWVIRSVRKASERAILYAYGPTRYGRNGPPSKNEDGPFL